MNRKIRLKYRIKQKLEDEKTQKIIILAQILLIAAVFTASYATSQSKYILDNKTAINYNYTFSGVGIDESLKQVVLDSSTSTTNTYKVTFPRSSSFVPTQDNKETYTMTNQTSECNISKITSGMKLSTSGNISFTAENTTNETIDVYITCQKDKENINFDVFVKYGEGEEYKYTNISFNTSSMVSLASSTPPIQLASPLEYNTLTVSLDNYYSSTPQVTNWLASSLSGDGTSKVNVYLEKYDIEETSPAQSLNKVDGITVSTNEDNTVTITTDETFGSRVETNAASDYENKKFYFPDNKSTIDALFYEYLDEYKYKKGTKEYAEIQNFLESKKEEYNVSNILEVAKILQKGIKYTAGTNYILVENNLYEIAKVVNTPSKTDTKILKTNELNTVESLKNSLIKLLSNSIDASKATSLINNNKEINTILTNILANPETNNTKETVKIEYKEGTKTKQIYLSFEYSANSNMILVTLNYYTIESNIINYEYNTNVTKLEIKQDLDSIAKNIYGITEGCNVKLQEPKYMDGTYNTNIGTIVVSTDSISNKKLVKIILK